MAMLTRSAGNRTQQAAGPAVQTNPSVNLLPPETLERKRARVITRRFVLAGVGVAAVATGVWLAQASAISAAESELVAAEAAHADAQARLTPLTPVRAFSASLQQQQEVVGVAMAGQTSFADTLDGFATAWPAGSNLRTLDATLGTGCAGPNPFQPAPSIGCLTWAMTVPGEQQVRDLTANLGTVPGLVSPYLTGAVRNELAFEANGTVNLDPQMLTGRFADLLEGAAQ